MRLKITIAAFAAVVVLEAGWPNAMGSAAETGRAAPTATTFAEGASAWNEARARAARAAAASGLVAVALDLLGPQVTYRSHPESLSYALRAYYSYRLAFPDQVRKPYLYFVDFGLDSRTPRGYVLDMHAMRVLSGPFMVAHGRGSEVGGSTVPTRFLNQKDSNATSLGLFLAEETYGFSGNSGGRRYRSIGLRLHGLSGRFNDAARERGIVVHGAPYVTAEKAGRSEGCPAMEPNLAEALIPHIAEGGLVFHFSPLDHRWMREDPWAGVVRPQLAGAL
jgi:hypothetical protein